MAKTLNIDEPQQYPQPAGPGLKPVDIYFVLFHHKWKILFFAFLGLAAAALLFFLTPAIYQSQAKLMIRYVVENRGMNPADDDSQVKTPDSRGDNILNSEMQILTSVDLIRKVVEVVGPERIVEGGENVTNLTGAIYSVRDGLKVDVPQNSSVIVVSFQHPNSQIVQPVLRQLIESYRTKHVEIHRAKGIVEEALFTQTDQLRAALAQTEADLRRAKSELGIFDVEEAKKTYSEELSGLKQQLFSSQRELAQRKALLSGVDQTGEQTSTNENLVLPEIPEELLSEYQDLVARLDLAQKKLRELLLTMTEANHSVIATRSVIEDLKNRRGALESEQPALKALASVEESDPGSSTDNLALEFGRIKGLEVTIDVLTNQIARVRADAARLDQAEANIQQLERQRSSQEKTYLSYADSLTQSKLDDALGGPGRISNIPVVQEPTGPSRVMEKLYKKVLMAAGGGVGFGLALAFLLDFILNPSLKRSGDVTTKLNIPLFMSLPWISKKDMAQAAKLSRKVARKVAKSAPAESNISYTQTAWKNGAKECAPWDPNHPLRDQFENLRDSLVADFELRQMDHKPKMVAVTSCNRGAGVSTLAAGLAATLSETGAGNVLLVDMHTGQGSAHPLHQGQPGCGLPDVLENQTREAGLVRSNLYLASASKLDGALPKILPKKFTHLIPKMKASDYDYIIFDMPPISKTSVTSRLASFMDITFLVFEAEKTGRDMAQQATKLLTAANGRVTSILNKEKKYIPNWLHQEL